MNALVLHGPNTPLVWESVPQPIAQSGFAVVEIQTAALNHRDVWISKGLYAGLKFPIILGSDGYGKVVECPNKPSWIGKDVLINPGINWGNDTATHGADFTVLGLPANGTFARYVLVPDTNLHDCPPHLNAYEAAALPLAGLTAFRALTSRANLASGQNILITGIGSGVALIALQIALAMHANVYVSSSSDHKIKIACEIGAKGGANYTQPDWASQLQNLCPSGFDMVLDSAAGAGFPMLIELANRGGKIVFFGGTAGSITQISPQKIFWKQLSLLGTTMGSPKEFVEMLDFVTQHNIKPVISHAFPMQEGQKAFELMAARGQMGKIILYNSNKL